MLEQRISMLTGGNIAVLRKQTPDRYDNSSLAIVYPPKPPLERQVKSSRPLVMDVLQLDPRKGNIIGPKQKSNVWINLSHNLPPKQRCRIIQHDPVVEFRFEVLQSRKRQVAKIGTQRPIPRKMRYGTKMKRYYLRAESL